MIKKNSWNFSVNLVDRAEKVGIATSTAIKDFSLLVNVFSKELGIYPGENLGDHPVMATKVLPEWQKSQFPSANLVERSFVECNLKAEVISQYGIGSDIDWSNLNPERRDLPC